MMISRAAASSCEDDISRLFLPQVVSKVKSADKSFGKSPHPSLLPKKRRDHLHLWERVV
jgi:hypothetical protein